MMATANLLSSCQFAGVLMSVDIPWPALVVRVLKTVDVLNFDLKLLRLGCVAAINVDIRFAMRVGIIIFGIAVLLLMHF